MISEYCKEGWARNVPIYPVGAERRGQKERIWSPAIYLPMQRGQSRGKLIRLKYSKSGVLLDKIIFKKKGIFVFSPTFGKMNPTFFLDTAEAEANSAPAAKGVEINSSESHHSPTSSPFLRLWGEGREREK